MGLYECDRLSLVTFCIMMIGLYEFGHISFGLTFPMTMDLHAADMDPLEKIEKRKWIFTDSDSGTKTCRPEPLAGNRVKRTDIVVCLQCYQHL
jgi:hypothetical protein